MGYMGKSGAPGRNFACNLRVRSAVLYTLSYGSVVEMVRRGGSAPPASAMSVRRSAIDLPARWCRTPDLHRDCPRSERGASAVGLVRRNGCPASIRTMTTWVRARQAAVTSRGNEMEPAAGTAPASSALQKRRDYLSIHAGRKWRKPEGMLPMRLRRTICFRNSPGTVAAFI